MAISIEAAVTPLPAWQFNPVTDATQIHRSIDAVHFDGNTVIDILTKRDIRQRIKIAKVYKNMFKKTLSLHLAMTTYLLLDDIMHFLLGIMKPLPCYYAGELHNAIAPIGTDEDTIIDILATLNNHYKKKVIEAYRRRYHHSLTKAVTGETSGSLRKLLLEMIRVNRSESTKVDDALVLKQTSAIVDNCIYGRDPEPLFFSIATHESYPHLAAISKLYLKFSGESINHYILLQFHKDVAMALFTIMNIAEEGLPAFFANRLHKAMNGLGTNEALLSRIVYGRSEIDLVTVASEFKRKFHGNLSKWVEDDTSGYYKRALLNVIGKH